MATTAYRTGRAADWQDLLVANLTGGWVSNPSLLPDVSQGDRFASLTLSGTGALSTEVSQLTFAPRLAVTRYDMFKNLNTDTGAVDAAYTRTFERGKWTFSAEALVDSTLTSELGLTGITNINRRHEAYSGTTSYESSPQERLSWFANGLWASNRYIDAASVGLEAYRYVSANLGPTWSFSDRVSSSLVLGADQTSTQSSPNQDTHSASLRVNSQWSERSAWSLQAGTTQVDAGPSHSTAALLVLTASSTGERYHWDASLRHDVSPIGLGTLARTDRATFNLHTALSERSELNFYCNLIRSAPASIAQFTVYNGAEWAQLGAEWHRQLTGNFDAIAGFSRAHARSGTAVPWADQTQIRLSILWQSRRP